MRFMPLARKELLDYAERHSSKEDACDVLEADCKIIIYLLDNCKITVPENNRFFVNVNCKGILNQIAWKRAVIYDEELKKNKLSDGCNALAFTGTFDIGHTTAEWERVISLGVYGIRTELKKYYERYATDDKKRRFFNNTIKVYDAALKFMKRCAEAALQNGKTEMANALLYLCKNSPSSFYEALQTTIIYYVLQHMFEGTYLRTLGRLDKLYFPYYKNENIDKSKSLIMDFIKEIDRLEAPSNIPFAIGGTDINENDIINELSYLFLDAYKLAHTNNTKLHILCSDNTPSDIIESAFNGIRSGNNSIVFLSDKKVIDSLKKLGIEHSDATNYHVVGCYECGGYNELTCSCNARVNITKALELALNGGKDMLTSKTIGLETDSNFNNFNDLYAEFERQLVYLCNCAMKCTDLFEKHYNSIHSAPILSATYTSSLEKGGDLYCDYSAKYCNSSVNALGLATAVDSLAAIKKAVFEDKLMTIKELTEILKSNWTDKEPMRLFIKNRYPKFGNGNKTIDHIAKSIVDKLSETINGKPNVKGGKYRLGLFSIDWRWDFGEKTAASADGRLSGEPLSQNTSASFGADKMGATAHLMSLNTIDTVNTPNGAIVDIDLPLSAVQGKNGLKSLVSTLKTYFEFGGFAVHYNVLDTEILKDAKRNPEKYPNLQVRLCGWNVLFSSLSDKEKEEFIARSIK